MRPESADRLPELLVAVIGHREDAMRRRALVDSVVMLGPFDGEPGPMAASMPVRRPRRKSGAVTSCSEGRWRRGTARSCEAAAEASGYYGLACFGRTGYQERTPWLEGMSGDDRPADDRANLGGRRRCFGANAVGIGGSSRKRDGEASAPSLVLSTALTGD